MNIVSLIGPIGVGKTTTLKIISDLGYSTMKENYIACDVNDIDNRFLISKWYWIANWFKRVIDLSRSSDAVIVFSDRSPLEAGLWTEQCSPLMEALKVSFCELKLLNIQVRHVYLKCDRDILWSRVQERLQNEPHRMKYNENNLDFFNALVKAYDRYNSLWDHVVDTSCIKPDEVAMRIINNY